jgi:hypothetical protein
MKKIIVVGFIFAAMWSCTNANLFSPNANEKTTGALDGPSGNTVIELQIGGGFAGVNQQLLIDANRYVQFIDRNGQAGQIETVLATEELNRLITLFVEQDFVHLESQYFDGRIADAFIYRTIYRYSGANKQVDTDYFAAPSELKIILDNLLKLTQSLDGLALEFTTSADQLRHGEKITLTLKATNRSVVPLTLQTGGQRFDFFATVPGKAGANRAAAESLVWNWAYDKAFIAIVISETLQPGESRTYSEEWDGRSNKGDLLAGEFWLGGRLVAQPGGYSALRRVIITK